MLRRIFDRIFHRPPPMKQAVAPSLAASPVVTPTDLTPFVHQMAGTLASRIPFSLMIEVKGQAGAVNRLLKGTGWSAAAIHGDNYNQGGDCSHKEDGGGEAYVRLVGPTMTLADGALENLADVCARLQQHNITSGRTGAMRILVADDTLDGAQTTRFMGLVLGHEDVLYRVSQNGSKGREVNHKERFAQRPTTYVTRPSENTADAWRKMLNKRTGAINTATAGRWEVRMYDATTQARPIAANVALLLGMMGAAAEGRGDARVQRPAQADARPVGLERFRALVREAVGEGPIANQLHQQFLAAGGTFRADEPVPPNAAADGAFDTDLATAIADAKTRMATAFMGWRGGIWVDERTPIGKNAVKQIATAAPPGPQKEFARCVDSILEAFTFSKSMESTSLVAPEVMQKGDYSTPRLVEAFRRMAEGALDSNTTGGVWRADYTQVASHAVPFLQARLTGDAASYLELSQAMRDKTFFASSGRHILTTALAHIERGTPFDATALPQVVGEMIAGCSNNNDTTGTFQADKTHAFHAALDILRRTLNDANRAPLFRLWDDLRASIHYASSYDAMIATFLPALSKGDVSREALAALSEALVKAGNSGDEVRAARACGTFLARQARNGAEFRAAELAMLESVTPQLAGTVAAAAFSAWVKGDVVSDSIEKKLGVTRHGTAAQEIPKSCVLAVTRQLLDDSVAEAEIRRRSFEQGWYKPEVGVAHEDIPKVLNAYGLASEARSSQTVADIAAAAAGGPVVVLSTVTATQAHAFLVRTVRREADGPRFHIWDSNASGRIESGWITSAELEARRPDGRIVVLRQ